MNARALNADSPARLSLLGFVPRGTDFIILPLYAIAFPLMHWAAQPWGGAGFFSLWYPAAGLRFAVLWHCGLRLTPALMFTELTVAWATGGIELMGAGVPQEVAGILRPGLACALAVAGARRMIAGLALPLTLPAMPLGLAAVAAPALNALLVVPVEVLLPSGSDAYRSGADIVVALTGLAVGDLLGILVLAPPLLWAAAALDGSIRGWPSLPRARPLLGDALVMAACLALTVALWRAGLGAQPIPSLLAGAWIGLRHGRAAAWLAIIAEVTLFLPHSANAPDEAARLELHLGIAAVVLATWLAGSFADAQKAAQALLERRNRLLFQAERLKTLRAMSVAVIHEVSQPLSTLAIEASHLKAITSDLDPDVAESAAIVDRKARTLSELVRRLRRFGGRDVDEPSALPVAMLLDTALRIVAPELREHGVKLEVTTAQPDLVVQAQEIELTQALVNLIRNAVAETPDGIVRLSTCRIGEEVEIAVINAVEEGSSSGPGMGVGLIIARTIVEAHGGTLSRRDGPGLACFILSLPLTGTVA